MEELTNTDKAVLNRHAIRAKVLQALYAQFASGDEPTFVFKHLLEESFQTLRKTFLSNPVQGDDSKFLSDLFFDTLKKRGTLESLIQTKIENWDYQRIAIIDRILLLMGVYEMLHMEEVPVKVTINEYVELAKEFSTEKSNQFVNGILDALHLELDRSGSIKKSGRGLIDR